MDERMDATNGKRIVELLRKAAMGIYEGAKGKVMDNIAQLIGCYGAMDYRTIDKLADMVEEAIQHEHEKAYDAGYDAGFASADDWCAQHEDAMAEHGWVRLPKDADGEPIHMGDLVTVPWKDKVYEVAGFSCSKQLCSGIRTIWIDVYSPEKQRNVPLCGADSCRHYHAPPVEDVLREMLDKWGELPSNMTNEAIVAEYAAKLQLRDDAE